MLLAHLGTLSHRFDARIRLDARQFKPLQARLIKFCHNLIVETDSLNRATAIGQQYSLTKLAQLLTQVAELIFAEIYLGWNVLYKTIHRTLFLVIRQRYENFL